MSDAALSIGQPLFLVAFVLCVLALGAWLAARRRVGPLRLKKDGSMIDVVASRSLGLQAALLVVEVDGRRFLLGSTRSGLTRLGSWGAQQDARGER